MEDQLTWRKSRHSSGQGGNCVEVADLADGCRAVRDSKNPTGPALTVDPAQWGAFTDAISSMERRYWMCTMDSEIQLSMTTRA